MRRLLKSMGLILAGMGGEWIPMAEAAPTFSVSGFVDEEIYKGNHMVCIKFDQAGRMWVNERLGKVLVFEPNPNGASSYNYDYYEVATTVTDIPNFSTLTPVKSGILGNFLLDPRLRNDNFAMRFTGSIQIPTTGSYTFYLTSDDDSRLYIDNNQVVNRTSSGSANGTVTLTAGTHNIRVEYLEITGGQNLVVEWAGPGFARGPVAQGVFKAPSVFADFTSQVNGQGERGMTGLALDPDFANNRYVYVLFATPTDQRILRVTSNETFTAMVPGSAVILLSGTPNTNTVHKAGDLAFHPGDPNNLYVALGDDGERTFVSNLTNYNGKLLKISASDGKGLPSNPFYDGDINSVRSRIWSFAYRNPFRFTFDPLSSGPEVLYVSENGDGTDRLARMEKGADGAWPTSGYLTNSADGKRKVLHTSPPSKTAVIIIRNGPFAPGGNPVIYNARYGGGDRNEVRRWTLTGANLDALTPVAADGGNAFFYGYEGFNIVTFALSPDGTALYYCDSGQGTGSSTSMRLGRVRFVGGTSPAASFTATPPSGPAMLQVTFGDTSTAPGSTLATWNWSFGDGTGSTQQNPVHTYAAPGVYTVTLTVTNALGLNNTVTSAVTVYEPVTVTLTGQVYDGRTLPAVPMAVPTELRFYQKNGTTPLPFTGGTGDQGNVLAIPAGGVINASIAAQITGDGIVISAGEAAGDGVHAAYVGVPLAITGSPQPVSATFRLSDTLFRGRAVDTKGVPALVDIGVARGSEGAWYAFAGGRDFLPGSGNAPSNAAHRIVPDALGYFHIPISAGGGGATFYFDTTADTLVSSHGRVKFNTPISAAQAVVQNITVGLYNGGTGETNLSGIAETPNVDFETQIQSIFSTNCVACHNDIATNSGGLNLDPGVAFGELVGKESVEAPGVKLVDPGFPERSYLMEKLSAAVPQVGTSMRPGDPMATAQQALIRDWIKQLDLAGRLEFSSVFYAVQETVSPGTAVITVRRLGGTSAAVGVTAGTISGGTATSGSDYTAVSSPLSWGSGDVADKTFTVPILNDSLAEGNETVALQLANPTGGATLGSQAAATLTIQDRPFDAWRHQAFGGQANTQQAQPLADFDNDGVSNLVEYALNSNPASNQGNIAPSVSVGSGNKLEIAFSRNVQAGGLIYRVMATNALESGAWEVLATRTGASPWATAPGVVVSDDPGTGAVLVTDSVSITGQGKRFLRVGVERTTD